jgi:hypothetical protein
MHLDCYKIHEFAPEIVPGSAGREWMDTFQDRQPYRCLSLTMANSAGWEILCPLGLTIEWNGGPMEEAIRLTGNEAWPPVASVASGHFRRGIVTFHTGHLFRTPRAGPSGPWDRRTSRRTGSTPCQAGCRFRSP